MTTSFTEWNFENNDQAAPQDRNTYDANLTFFGSITPKTYALLDFEASKSNYVQNIQNDNFQWGVSTGIRLSPTGKTSGEIRAGYAFLTFDNAPVESTPPGLSTGGSNSPLFNFRGQLVWKPTSRLIVDLRPSRQFQQSGVNNTSVFTQTRVLLDVTQKVGARTSLSGNYQYDLEEFDDPQIIDGQLGIRTDQRS